LFRPTIIVVVAARECVFGTVVAIVFVITKLTWVGALEGPMTLLFTVIAGVSGVLGGDIPFYL